MLSQQQDLLDGQPRSLTDYLEASKRLLKQPNFYKSWQSQKQEYETQTRPFVGRLPEKQQDPKNDETVPLQVFTDQLPVEQKIEVKTVKVNNKALHLGVEFNDEIQYEKDLLAYLIANRYYIREVYMTEDQLAEFDEIFKNINQLDGRNIGSLVGMAMLGVLGFVALGFSVVGIVVGSILGIIMGRYAGKRIKRSLQKTQNKLKQIDIYEIRIRCIIKWIRVRLIKYKFNINMLRFMVERLILEIKPALHYKYFAKHLQSQVKYLLRKIIALIKQPVIYSTLLLSYKLCVQFWDQLVEISIIETQPEMLIQKKAICDQKLELEIALLKIIDNVLKPIDTLISFSKVKKGDIFWLRKDIEKFLLKPEIRQLSELFPDPQMSIQFIKLFANKMKTPVKVENIEFSVKEQNFRDIENMGMMIGQEGKNQASYDPQLFQLEKVEEKQEESNSVSYSGEEEKQSSQNDQQQSEDKNQEMQPHLLSQKQVQDFSSPNQEKFKVIQHFSPPMGRLSNEFELTPMKLILKEHPNKVNLEYLVSNMGDYYLDQPSVMARQSQGRSNSVASVNNVHLSIQNLDHQAQSNNNINARINLGPSSVKSLSVHKAPPQYDSFVQGRFDLFFQTLDEPLSTWDKVMEKEEIRIYKTMKPGVGCVFVKGDVMLRNVCPKIGQLTMCSTEYRAQWDKLLSGFRMLEDISEDVQIMTFFTPSPFPFISGREFLQKRITRLDFPKPGDITLLFFSVEHKKLPINKDRVRVQTDIAGYLFEPVPGGTKMHFISNNDVKGSIPKAFVNYASAKAPYTWFAGLKKAAAELQQVNGDFSKIKPKK